MTTLLQRAKKKAEKQKKTFLALFLFVLVASSKHACNFENGNQVVHQKFRVFQLISSEANMNYSRYVCQLVRIQLQLCNHFHITISNELFEILVKLWFFVRRSQLLQRRPHIQNKNDECSNLKKIICIHYVRCIWLSEMIKQKQQNKKKKSNGNDNFERETFASKKI